MNLYLATFVVNGRDSDTDAINSAVSMLDFAPVIRATNMHVFLVRSEKSQSQLLSLLQECLDPADFAYVAPVSATAAICQTFEEALHWIRD